MCFVFVLLRAADGKDLVLHFCTLLRYVLELAAELLDWIKNSNVHHMFIHSCVLSNDLNWYPFTDGDSQVDGCGMHCCLIDGVHYPWSSEGLLRFQWRRQVHSFCWVYAGHYSSIAHRYKWAMGRSTGSLLRKKIKIEKFLKAHDYIMNTEVRELCGISAATVNSTLTGLVENGRLIKNRMNGCWTYKYWDCNSYLILKRRIFWAIKY